MKLNIKALALTCGILWALASFCLALFALYLDWGNLWVNAMSRFYMGYNASWLGAFLGLFWGFIDGLVGGAVFAWLYNKLAK